MNIYINGNIFDENYILQEAMVEKQGTFIFVGSNIEARKYHGTIIDLKGKYVLPGFNDSHMHLVSYGSSLQDLSLSKYTSIKEVLFAIKEHLPSKGWLIARGWNQDLFIDEQRFITKQELDAISKDIPIIITRACGHVLIANSKAISMAAIKNIKIDGGSYNLKSGVFKENAMTLLYEAIAQPSIKEIKNYILLAQKKLNSYGITSVQSDDLLSLNTSYQNILDAFFQLEQEQRLTIRVYQQAQLVDLETIKEFITKGYHTGVGTEYFKIGPLKIIGDGSLGAKTAFLSKPYIDDEKNRGIALYSKDEITEMCNYANNHKMQIAIHAIGDEILDWVLEAYQEVLAKHPKKDHRHGIVHLQITRQEQLEKIKELQLHGYIQSIFLEYDNHIVKKRVVNEIADTSYHFKTLLENSSISNGSDCPVELPDVCMGMQLAITRTSTDGTGPYLKQQALSRKQAVDSFTKNGAYASFEEDIKGQIKKGMLADFIVVDKNIFTVAQDKIKDIKVLQTYIGGKLVYQK